MGATKLTDQLKAVVGDMEFYQLYFREPGKAEKELEEDVRATMLKLLYAGSGDAGEQEQFRFAFPRSQRFIDGHVLPPQLPLWLTEDDLTYFSREFERTGFR